MPFTCGAYLKFTYLCKYDEPYRTPKEKPSFVPDIRTGICDGLPAQGVDFRILNHLQEHRTPAINNVMSWTSNSLVLAPAVPIGLSVAGLAADNRDVLHAGCVTGLSFATTFLLRKA